MTHYIFKEVSPGVVAHTSLSKAIAEMPSLEDTIGFVTVELWPSATRVVDAMEKSPNSEEPNEAGFSLANDTNIPMFDYVSRNPERAGQSSSNLESRFGPQPAISFAVSSFPATSYILQNTLRRLIHASLSCVKLKMVDFPSFSTPQNKLPI